MERTHISYALRVQSCALERTFAKREKQRRKVRVYEDAVVKRENTTARILLLHVASFPSQVNPMHRLKCIYQNTRMSK